MHLMSLLTFHSLMYTEDFTVLVVVSETAGLFDDVISAYVFGLPDSERCAGAVQHSEDKVIIILETKFCFGRN